MESFQKIPYQKILSRMGVPLGIIGTVGGFISDVMAPLGDFAPAVAIFSLVLLVASSVLFFILGRNDTADPGESLIPAVMVLSAGSTVIFAVWSIVLAGSPDNGYLAENIDPIANVQATLLNLEEDIAEIQETTDQIQQTTEDTQAAVEDIAAVQAEEVALAEDTNETVTEIQDDLEMGLEEIRGMFEELSGTQVIIENPASPPEWYSNARVYQLKGDTTNAITAYEGYIQFGLEYVDPLYDYASLLTATEGIARARDTFNILRGQQPDNPAVAVVAATLLDTAEGRADQLDLLSLQFTDFPPLQYEIGQAYSNLIVDTYTAERVTKLNEAFASVLAAEQANQGYSRFFIDKVAAQNNLQTAQTLADAYANYVVPDEITVDFYYQGEQFTVTPQLGSDIPKDIRFGLNDPEMPIYTGSNEIGGGLYTKGIPPIPYSAVGIGDHIFYFQYLDQADQWSDVYEIPFSFEPIVMNFLQLPYDFDLEGIPGTFSLILVEPVDDFFAEYTWRYSIDSDVLDQTFVESNWADTPIIGPFEQGEHSFYVQATYPDGTTTDIIEIPFTVN